MDSGKVSIYIGGESTNRNKLFLGKIMKEDENKKTVVIAPENKLYYYENKILDLKKGSIGKQKVGLKLYFKKREFKYSVIRNIVKFLPWQIGHMGTIHGIYTEFDTISIILQIIALTLLVTMFLMGILRKDKRHLGDIVAGTQIQL